jgi:hypothetical protein
MKHLKMIFFRNCFTNLQSKTMAANLRNKCDQIGFCPISVSVFPIPGPRVSDSCCQFCVAYVWPLRPSLVLPLRVKHRP